MSCEDSIEYVAARRILLFVLNEKEKERWGRECEFAKMDEIDNVNVRINT